VTWPVTTYDNGMRTEHILYMKKKGKEGERTAVTCTKISRYVTRSESYVITFYSDMYVFYWWLLSLLLMYCNSMFTLVASAQYGLIHFCCVYISKKKTNWAKELFNFNLTCYKVKVVNDSHFFGIIIARVSTAGLWRVGLGSCCMTGSKELLVSSVSKLGEEAAT